MQSKMRVKKKKKTATNIVLLVYSAFTVVHAKNKNKTKMCWEIEISKTVLLFAYIIIMIVIQEICKSPTLWLKALIMISCYFELLRFYYKCITTDSLIVAN